jgi:hypothetical protein
LVEATADVDAAVVVFIVADLHPTIRDAATKMIDMIVMMLRMICVWFSNCISVIV